MRKLTALLLLACVAASLAASASAAGPLEYTIDAPPGPDYGNPTSIEPVYTADGGAMKNEDVSKDAALIPPVFGSASADAIGTGTPLTPNLAPGSMAAGTATGSQPVILPPETSAPDAGGTTVSTGRTEVTSDLYYSEGHLGVLSIPALGLSVRIYEGTSDSVLAKGVGHFEETSIWDGNTALAGHNRGANQYFGELHTLSAGDQIVLTTKLGTRTYEVSSVSKISEMDRSGLAFSAENVLTLYTCVRGQSAYRWCVRAVAA